MNYKITLVLLLSFFLSKAQNEFIDTSFGENGGYTLTVTGVYDLWLTSLVDFNGSFYASHYNFNDDGFAFKYDENGLLDTTFGDMGILDLNERGNLAWNPFGHAKTGIFVTSDDQLLITSGSYTAIDTPDFRVMINKFDTNGQFDTSYGSNGQYLSTLPMGMDKIGSFQLEDDKILMVGYNSITNANNPDHNIYIIQVDAAGQLDTNFGVNGTIVLPFDINNFTFSEAFYKDGSLYMQLDDYSNDGYITKYDLDTMSYDTSFGTNGQLLVDNFGENEVLESFFIDDDGSIYIAGSVYLGTNLMFDLFLYKYVNGSLDNTFGTNGIVNFQLIPNTNSVTDAHFLNRHGDKLLITGTSYNWDAESYEKAFFAQFNLDGSLDTDFGNNGIIINYLFDNLNVPFAYLYYADSIITAGSCPDGNDPQIPCLVKYLKQSNLSVEEATLETVKVFPNPVKDELHFQTNTTIERLEIFDVLGRTIKRLEVSQNKVDLSDLETGHYFLKVYSANQTFNLKIIKG